MEAPKPHHHRVLVVEDDSVTARDVEAILQRRGFELTCLAHSADEARQSLEESKPDVALIDIQLNNTNVGVKLASELRQNHAIPVIFLTGYSADTVLEEASEAKPAAFIRKPFSGAELVACLNSVFEQATAKESLEAKLPGIAAISDELEEVVIVTDRESKVTYINPSAESMLGWSANEALGKAQSEILEFVETDSAISGLKNKAGALVPISEKSSAIRSDDGEVVGVMAILTPTDSQEAAPNHEVSDPEAPRSDLPPARADALKKIATLSQDPAFRELLGSRAEQDQPGEAEPIPSSGFTPPTESSQPTNTTTDENPSPLIDDLTDPLIKIDTTGKVTYANHEASALFGNGKNLIGLSFWDRFSTTEFQAYDEPLHRPLASGRRNRFEFQDTTRDLWFEVRSYRAGDGVLALFTDITSNKLEDAESLRQQRLEGLGLLARGFSHDFNNRLTAITGNISLARERQQDDFELQNLLNEAQAAATQASSLVQQLMTFAQGGRPIRKQTRISDLIRRILIEHRIHYPEIRYQFQGAPPDLIANIDPAQISRLVENLIANSALAMGQGGILIVRCARISPDEVKSIKGSHSPTQEDHLLIEVIDTGHGMAPQALNQVFEPYFTTRPENNASGIGLTVCESIAKAHSGFIQLQSKEGKGTIATFCAPLGKRPTGETEGELDQQSGAELPVANLDLPALGPLNGSESENFLVGTRILILEDDAPIRRLMAATLRRAGHEVVETKDGNDTIAAYKQAAEDGIRFHLIICDLTIENGLGGVETMRQLTEFDPSILAIVSSGYSDAPAMANPGAFGFRAVLPKPYAPSELRSVVHRLLAAHQIIS